MARLSMRQIGRDAAALVFRPYAQLILSRRIGAGVLVFAAIATFPRVALASLLGLAVAQVAVIALGFGRDAARDGIYASAAILTALAATMGPSGASAALVIAGAALAVLFAAALPLVLARSGLPALSLPFVAAAWIVQLAAKLVPQPLHDPVAPWSVLPLSWFAPSVLDVPAAMLYVNGMAAGVLLLLAVAWHSRISVLLAGAGALASAVVHALLRHEVDVGPTDVTAGFNAMLTAMALGGTFFVPHPSSIALAFFGGSVASVFTYALFPLSGLLGLPLLSLPFALTTLLIVAAMRARERDRYPATAPATATGPEDALERHLMRVRRFGEFAWLPFRLPFRGAWTVTQGHNGEHTHQGPWRYAFDFEVIGHDGRAYQTDGREVRDYRCYNLPVLAAGNGMVDQIYDGIPDNAIGGINAHENWGNSVVISHGAELYSVYSHLRAGSITVKAGDPVRAGAEIGRCGNSGRSLVPHLHFHVQRGAPLGSATVAADFGDVVERHADRTSVAQRAIPGIGALVRPILRDESLATALSFALGSAWQLTDDASGRAEIARVEADLWGRRILRSAVGALYFEAYENALVAVAFDGERESLLRVLLVAMARVPFDQEGTFEWTDKVPRRLLASWPWGVLDLVTVVAPGFNDWDVKYTGRRREGTFVIAGESGAFRSEAVLSLANAPHRLTITSGGHSQVVRLAPAPATESAAR